MTEKFPAEPARFVQPELGMHADLDFEDYKQAQGVNASFIKAFADCPAKAIYGGRKETPALAKGSLIHCAILEAHQLEKRYCPTDLERRGTKAWEAEEVAAGGRIMVKRPDFDDALAIRDSVYRHPTARALLSGLNATEQSFFWIDPATGLLCKGRADATRPDMRTILDVKSTVSAARRDFENAVGEYKYHWQETHYRNGVQEAAGWVPEAFVFIVVEKEKPFLVATYEIDSLADPAFPARDSDIDLARRSVATQLERIAACQASGEWPGYNETIETISLPAWARRKEEGDL